MLNIQEAWDRSKVYLQDKLGKATFETWILPLKPKEANDAAFVLLAPDNFFRDWVEKHYMPAIREAITWSTKEEIRIILETSEQAKGELADSAARTAGSAVASSITVDDGLPTQKRTGRT